MAKKEKQPTKAKKPMEQLKKPAEPSKKPPAQLKKPPQKQAVKALAECVFWCHDGRIFTDLMELAAGLEAMSDETYAYHSNLEKQDFSNWVRDIIEDEWLAEELARATNRLEAAICVSARITLPEGR
jgi:hypothetical protein